MFKEARDQEELIKKRTRADKPQVFQGVTQIYHNKQ
jgi:hypothetical protein